MRVANKEIPTSCFKISPDYFTKFDKANFKTEKELSKALHLDNEIKLELHHDGNINIPIDYEKVNELKKELENLLK